MFRKRQKLDTSSSITSRTQVLIDSYSDDLSSNTDTFNLVFRRGLKLSNGLISEVTNTLPLGVKYVIHNRPNGTGLTIKVLNNEDPQDQEVIVNSLSRMTMMKRTFEIPEEPSSLLPHKMNIGEKKKATRVIGDILKTFTIKKHPLFDILTPGRLAATFFIHNDTILSTEIDEFSKLWPTVTYTLSTSDEGLMITFFVPIASKT